MAGKVLAVAKREEIERLKGLGLTDRAIARVLWCSRKTIKKILYPPEFKKPESTDRDDTHQILPRSWCEQVEWNKLHDETLKGTPLLVLWEELREADIVPLQFPGFWKQFRKRFPDLPKSMHRVFEPGVRAEIDYCDGIDLLNPVTGELISTQLFVGVLCFSRYVFAEFTLSQKSCDFLASHVRMFEYFGGVPQILSPDNLKSAVTKTHRYDPVINPAYTRLADHYNVAVVPARVKTPKDKAIVERTIQCFQRWFYFRVRHKTFTSLVELNQCLREHIEVFHSKKHRILRRTRKDLFESERSSLHSLPHFAYVVSTYRKAKPYADCHLVFEKAYYSAPFQLRGHELDVWATDKTVEICQNGTRVAFHSRAKSEGQFVTDSNHYPPEHQAYAETTPNEIKSYAEKIGPETLALVQRLLSGSTPLKHLRRSQGVVGLAKKYGKENLEKAAKKANLFNQSSIYFLENILKRGRLESDSSKIRPINRDSSNPLLRGDELFH